MAAMKVAVLSLDRLQSLQPILKLLGTRQREAGGEPRGYDAFKSAPGCGRWSSRSSPASPAKQRRPGRRCSAR